MAMDLRRLVTEAAENWGSGFGVSHGADVLIAIDRVQARDSGAIQAEEHQLVVFLAVQQIAARAPFQSAPVLRVVFLAQENDDDVRLVVVEPGEIGVEVRPVELSRVPDRKSTRLNS